MRIRSIAVLIVSVVLFSAACGGDDDVDTDDVSSTSAAVNDETNIEVATINVLHGLVGASGCLEETDACNAPVRVDILWDYLESDVGCPEIIALQEISARWQELVPEKLPELCEGDHVLLTESLGLPDQEMILTTLPVIDHGRVELAGAPVWSAHWAQLDADGQVVDVFATHFASSSLNLPCDPSVPHTTCSPVCEDGLLLGDCHPLETLEFLEANAAEDSLQLVIGDLNKEIDDIRITTLTDAGFIDTYLEAGLSECDESTGVGCTSGIGGETDYDGLDIAEQTPRSRIDFILARPAAGCSVVVESEDTDGDGTTTGHWANTPLDEPIEGLYWAADHIGIKADVGMAC
ncbi:MAG: hypothetical protein IH940_03150 [Acidobacteria bacterium]|nr:hypothetical protein [Acidobacteriota bacterium]